MLPTGGSHLDTTGGCIVFRLWDEVDGGGRHVKPTTGGGAWVVLAVITILDESGAIDCDMGHQMSELSEGQIGIGR
jgi:hypothetical protein